ncbi:MAG: hypothetical protein ACERKO_08410, partial [Acetanaerobacterium sp.]
DSSSPIKESSINIEYIMGATLYGRQYGRWLLTNNINDENYKLLEIPENRDFLCPTTKGLVFSDEDSLFVTDDALQLMETIPYPQELKTALQGEPSSLKMTISDDLNYILRADQGGEAVVRENGVTLFSSKGQTAQKILPEDYYYYQIVFARDNNVIYASRTSPLPDINIEFVLYDIQTGETTVIGNDSSIGAFRGICLPDVMFEKGIYNINNQSFTSIELPDNSYTMTPNGKIYSILDGQLYEYDPKTQQSIGYEFETPMEFTGFHWTHMNTNSQLVLFFYSDTLAGSPIYPAELYCLSLPH